MGDKSERQKNGAEAAPKGADPAAIAPPAWDRLPVLWRQLVDHRIVQWSVGYAAVAYGLQHAITLTSEALEFPHGIERVSMVLFALGLPLAMTLAWYHGERASRGYSRAEFSILSVLLVIGAFLFYVFVRPPEQVAARPLAAAPPVSAAEPAAKPAGISVAVLPFLNLSGDPNEEYFSDGMTEEITAALAQVKGLRVIGRTSAFAFKGKNEDLHVIGKALGATHVIEGSVRKAGNQLRITAQLIEIDNDSHLWADSYDKEMKDVFAVQESVAKSIAGALQVPLNLKQGETLVSNRTSDTQSYDDYLRAQALYRARKIKEVIAILEPMVRRDPNYAPAWALLAQDYGREPTYLYGVTQSVDELHRNIETALGNAEMAARKAIALDPKYAPGYTALGLIETQHGNWAAAADAFQKGLALDPADPDLLHAYALMLSDTGQLKQALNVRMTLRKLEQYVAVYNMTTAQDMQINGDVTGAIALLEGISPDGPVGSLRDSYLALAYATQGRYALAAETILKITPDQGTVSMPVVKQAADIIRKAPARIAAGSPSPVSESGMSFVYAFVGAPERLLDMQEHNWQAGYVTLGTTSATMWDPYPSFATSRKTERFKSLVRRMGLVDYWRARGWPDLCHPTTGDDFACN